MLPTTPGAVKDEQQATADDESPHAPPVQLLGYYLALLRGHDPDKPRNLAKSVTVK